MHSPPLKMRITSITSSTCEFLSPGDHSRRLDLTSSCLRSLQPILISRFLINLRQASDPAQDANTTNFSRFSAPGFQVPAVDTFVGNMGESLDFGFEDDDEDVGDDVLEASQEIYEAGAESVAIVDRTSCLGSLLDEEHGSGPQVQDDTSDDLATESELAIRSE